MIYELRIYHINPGKRLNMNNRFENPELTLFAKHGIHVCDMWEDHTGVDKIYYICAFKDIETREAAWKSFGDDPEWKKVAAETEKDGKLVGKVEVYFLNRVPYIKPDWPDVL